MKNTNINSRSIIHSIFENIIANNKFHYTMNHTKRGIILFKTKMTVILLLVTLSCSNHKDHNEVQLNSALSTFDSFPKQKNITFREIVDYKKGIPKDMFFEDSTLIIFNLSKNIDAFFYNYSLKTKSFSNGYIKKGRGPNEAIGGFCAGVQKNKLWMYDLTMNKVLTIDKSLALKGQSILTNAYSINNSYYKISLIDSLNFLAVGDCTSKYKIQLVNLISNKKVAEFGEFVGISDSSPLDGIKDAYQAFPYLKPSGGKILLAYRLTDVIEIYDHTNKCIALQGPSMINPDLKFGSRGKYHFFNKDKKTKKAFIAGTVTEDYIYLAFSGQTKSDTWSYAKYVYIYDWEGNPVKELILDQFISALAVSPDNEKLYAYDAIHGFIIETNIN
jgi:hypothetical protein